MKKISLIIIAVITVFASCKKQSNDDTAAGNADPNYDAHNRIFRVKASATSTFKLTIIEYNSDGVTPYNTETADQSSPFDYGFSPVIGHKITVSLQSPSGVLTSSVLYKGNYLDPVTINNSGDGTSGSFSYTVKD